MTRKRLDAMREVRLWIGQIIVPAVTTTGVLMTIPEVRSAVVEKIEKVKQNVKKKRS